MESQAKSLAQLIKNFAQQYTLAYQEKLGHLPLVESDEQWPSPCEVDEHKDGLWHWQPVEVSESLSFDNVEDALDIKLHPAFKTYFSAIYSETLYAICSEGHLQLLFAWSKDDFARLQQNVIGHVLMKQKLKQPVTLFFALTDEEDLMLSVDNVSGEVWVERVGCVPHKKIADSLSDFIASLQPDIYLEQ